MPSECEGKLIGDWEGRNLDRINVDITEQGLVGFGMVSQAEKRTATRKPLTIAQAAEFLGVSIATLRNWDKGGKLKPARHPINGYRLYKYTKLFALKQRIKG